METGCGFLLLYHVLNLGGKQHQISSGNFGVGVRGLGLLFGGGAWLVGCTDAHFLQLNSQIMMLFLGNMQGFLPTCYLRTEKQTYCN